MVKQVGPHQLHRLVLAVLALNPQLEAARRLQPVTPSGEPVVVAADAVTLPHQPTARVATAAGRATELVVQAARPELTAVLVRRATDIQVPVAVAADRTQRLLATVGMAVSPVVLVAEEARPSLAVQPAMVALAVAAKSSSSAMAVALASEPLLVCHRRLR